MQNKVIFLQGKSVLSPFRLSQLQSKLNIQCNSEKSKLISVKYLYIINISVSVDANIEKYEKLLNAKVLSNKTYKNRIYIAPRIGTISPWSSKASDIFHNCGFEEVLRVEQAKCYQFLDGEVLKEGISEIYDRMLENKYVDLYDLKELFLMQAPQQDSEISILKDQDNLNQIDNELGLALSGSEKEYVQKCYQDINKEPTQTELMMFAQANSEHCRHKIFNAEWTIDQNKQPKSLFAMIRNTEANTPKAAISAYKDNSAVFFGGDSVRWILDDSNKYIQAKTKTNILIKVETHNHPTAISPHPGAATGAGGEIRDEAATGQGSRPKAGLTGYSVSHLKIPGHIQQWEQNLIGSPSRIATSMDIMIEAPIGGAEFNNEFGRPNICGYFRSLEINTPDFGWRGYHKPIMLAGGLGTINDELSIKQDTEALDILVVLGGPAMLIGLGGGAASSVTSGTSSEFLDFASVQRGNPEMERRCQEVIDSCWTQSENSPIRSIHDVGAGGLSNAMPELLDDAGLGGILELRNLQIDTTSMTPMEIWCNESQERYVISIKPDKIEQFKKICERERCPYAILGKATLEKNLIVKDQHFQDKPVDIPMSLLFGNTPKTKINIARKKPRLVSIDLDKITLHDAVNRILNFPTVASKKYLITIADRSVSGLVHRDQMVGPWQIPVADCGVTLRDYYSNSGEVMSIGEKAPLALINGAASARMAVSEALTNIAANNIGPLSNIKMSANWMAASGIGRENEVLFDAVKAIGEELCPKLEIGIPVGKDSLSMNTKWDDNKKQVTSPMSLLISAFANIEDVSKSITPYFERNKPHSLYYVDLGLGKKRMGASSLVQVYSQLGNQAPDLDEPEILIEFWNIMQTSIEQQLLAAYHDISDGGLFVSILEMCIASQTGANINLDFSTKDSLEVLFAEELGAVIAVESGLCKQFESIYSQFKINNHIHKIAKVASVSKDLIFTHENNEIFKKNIDAMHKQWAQTSHWMASHRDNSEICEQEFQGIGKDINGLKPQITFDYDESIIAPYLNLNKPKVAILREQGVNGQKEMAMAFSRAGFECYDVHMQDILQGDINIMEFQGMAACGGFSYGDVLGAGKGWANSILFHSKIKNQFEEYFKDLNKFTLGVCNGCQMVSSLKEIIPGSQHWPEFIKNSSEQFEARFSSIQIEKSDSVFFNNMQGARIPIVISHGEGRAIYKNKDDMLDANISAKYIDNNGQLAKQYPFNPNGSQGATAAISNTHGNVMIMMPHPERVFRSLQMSWKPKQWQENSPWMRMFYNARKFVN